MALRELHVKFVEEGQNFGFDSSLREFSTNSSLSRCMFGASFETRVKLLGPPLAISKTMRNFRI